MFLISHSIVTQSEVTLSKICIKTQKRFNCSFMAVPFVFELRTLMDWIWTDTSMTLMDWLKMEDIFASVFLLKVKSSVI